MYLLCFMHLGVAGVNEWIRLMNDPACKEFFDNNYVIDHLVVKESENNKHLENPGAEDLLKQYKGANSGIPFWLDF